MVKAILASATPERDDRLFPGDITQFSDGGGLGVAHGAAGVLYALSRAGAERYEEGERWLLAHTDPVPVGTPLGLYDGLAGVAHVLDLLGHRPRALDLIDLVLREKWHKLSSDLRGGLAGLGLVLGGLARTTGESEFARRAQDVTDILVSRLEEPLPDPPKRRAGLLRGASGPALLFLRLFEHSGDRSWLDLAGQALDRDLAECMVALDGSTQVRDGGYRTLPYVEVGGAGIAMVLNQYARHAPDAESVTRLPDLLRGAAGEFVIHPGLMLGRQGQRHRRVRLGNVKAVGGKHLVAVVRADAGHRRAGSH
jgi:hypothetical protein